MLILCRHGKDDKKLCEKNSEIDEMIALVQKCIVAKNPAIRWKDVVLSDQVKKSLEEAIIHPFKSPDLSTEKKTPKKEILLYGVNLVPNMTYNLNRHLV